MLEIHRSAHCPKLEELFNKKSLTLNSLWGERREILAPKAWLTVNPDHLCFGFEYQGNLSYDRAQQTGSFVKGLWEHDVAELFICADQGPQYQEFNLSPSGAWWCGNFIEYRKEAASCTRPQVQIFSEYNENLWRAMLKVPRASLGVACSFSKGSRLNVCAILGHPNPMYFSLAELNSPKPDFHRTKDFLAIT